MNEFDKILRPIDHCSEVVRNKIKDIDKVLKPVTLKPIDCLSKISKRF